mmetsp:Transcript_71591/g.207285  ORF Transcript_71591/g.207285 Transcript_71591/m.207285 type:complete len:370 (+) Transcript_71591:28-1137(+)
MAFDFDELDEAALARLRDGSTDEAALAALGAAEAPSAWGGGFLPPMRNIAHRARAHLPSRTDLPAYLPMLNLPGREAGPIRVRLFLFYGAGDSIAAWAGVLGSELLPEWLDVAIFECPGHGQRCREAIPRSLAEVAQEAYGAVADVLREHTCGGTLEGAPFALAGHSMGAQIAADVAAMAKRKLGLEPCSLFAMDRGAPHLPLYTEEGYRLLCLDEPSEFFEGFNPTIHKMMSWSSRSDLEKDTERMIRMWQQDLRLSQEHLWAEGYHIFHCPIYVFCARRNFLIDQMLQQGQKVSADLLRMHSINCRITSSGSKSSAPWSEQSYHDWGKWTTERCEVHAIDADHVSIKLHGNMWKVVVSALDALTHVA